MQPEQSTPGQPTEARPTWTFNAADKPAAPEAAGGPVDGAAAPTESISWTASEFIAHAKSAMWYLGLILVTLGAVALFYFVSGDMFIIAVIVIISILFGYVGSRKPRELPYSIDSQGLNIDQKNYPFAKFKSFALVDEGGVEAIWLMPLQRFAPGLSIYFDPSDRDKIVDILGDFLPIEERKPDLVDTLMHKIRF